MVQHQLCITVPSVHYFPGMTLSRLFADKGHCRGVVARDDQTCCLLCYQLVLIIVANTVMILVQFLTSVLLTRLSRTYDLHHRLSIEINCTHPKLLLLCSKSACALSRLPHIPWDHPNHPQVSSFPVSTEHIQSHLQQTVVES